ncbi:ATP-grasp domain-containing protein [Paraburkholderia pallida]|uniref:ATP-grasp domain-containing protein n=1 Tax=Paraburkholderia pallida TaxID=2547399 RepID=A0A4P7CZN8_9BURK|nr:ATP-grasp domain-containing protein [Paraburkholderia pallida]QBQ99543.1 ATP-grasp domain-containing protein [Paraburkholderia pallida]
MTRPAIVVAGLSVRMLAESARRAGWRVIALDLFGDSDTRGAAQRWHPVGQAAALALDPARTRAALERASDVPGVMGWIAGSGFEACPALLHAEIDGLPRIGNAPQAWDAVRTPDHFFAILNEHGIACPETRMEPPHDASGWLRKEASGTGGWHIRLANVSDAPAHDEHGNHYYQRICTGRPMSALFLADGRHAQVLGINEQIVARHGEHPFAWRGAIGPVQVGERLAHAVHHAVQAIVAASGLVGLNSLDFLSDGERCVVLEVNARPSATMALYDCEPHAPLLARHVRACQGEALETPEEARATTHAPPVRGQLVVFAQADHAVTPAFEDQARRLGWCHDIPVAGNAIAAGTPLCTVSATCAPGTSVDAVRAALAARAAAIEPLMKVSHERSYACR